MVTEYCGCSAPTTLLDATVLIAVVAMLLGTLIWAVRKVTR